MSEEANKHHPPPPEARAYKRFLVQLPIEYKLAAIQDDLNQASTLDVSGNGLRLRIKDKPSIGEEVHLSFEIPDKGKVVLAARVIWFKKVEEGTAYETGVKLAETASEAGRKFMDYYTQEMLSFLDENRDSGQMTS